MAQQSTQVYSALGRWRRQEDCKFQASVGYTVRPCLRNKTKQNSMIHEGKNKYKKIRG
jgi:hypothetical protein